MNRRHLNKAFALAPLSCLVAGFGPAQAQTLPATPARPAEKAGEKPQPYRTVNVAEDGRRVLFFFDFGCPFCAAYHGPLLNFAATVPQQIQTMFIPVVNLADLSRRQEQIIAAKCYYAAMEVATKAQMSIFSASIYESYPEVRNLVSKAIWIKAIKAAGIDPGKFSRALGGNNTELQGKFAARKTIQYALTATPSIAVGGKYVITPDDVVGDQSMFFQLLNGLTSAIL